MKIVEKIKSLFAKKGGGREKPGETGLPRAAWAKVEDAGRAERAPAKSGRRAKRAATVEAEVLFDSWAGRRRSSGRKDPEADSVNDPVNDLIEGFLKARKAAMDDIAAERAETVRKTVESLRRAGWL